MPEIKGTSDNTSQLDTALTQIGLEARGQESWQVNKSKQGRETHITITLVDKEPATEAEPVAAVKTKAK